eukprot:531370-Prymnesium_polylepis.1
MAVRDSMVASVAVSDISKEFRVATAAESDLSGDRALPWRRCGVDAAEFHASAGVVRMASEANHRRMELRLSMLQLRFCWCWGNLGI